MAWIDAERDCSWSEKHGCAGDCVRPEWLVALPRGVAAAKSVAPSGLMPPRRCKNGQTPPPWRRMRESALLVPADPRSSPRLEAKDRRSSLEVFGSIRPDGAEVCAVHLRAALRASGGVSGLFSMGATHG